MCVPSLGAMSQRKGCDFLDFYDIFLLLTSAIPSAEPYSRYLTAVDSSYYDGLSDASKKSLAFQGGPFEGKELEAFERHPLKDEMVRVRKWDDMSKVVGIIAQTPRAATYRGLIRKHLEGE
jgi:2-amino-1-hydroxyethylphosphonate dioxygenase (glycine-forming)